MIHNEVRKEKQGCLMNKGECSTCAQYEGQVGITLNNIFVNGN